MSQAAVVTLHESKLRTANQLILNLQREWYKRKKLPFLPRDAMLARY